MFAARARDNSAFVALCNMVGGQDELVFDGHSVVLDDEGEVVARAPGFEEALLVVDVDPTAAIGRRLRDVRRRALARELEEVPAPTVVPLETSPAGAPPAPGGIAPLVDDLEQMRLALELGLRAYVDKNGFRDVVVGLSGGIDSALTAALAAEVLGPARVHCVSMPSRFSSEATRADARRLAESVGVDFREIPIDEVVVGFEAALEPSFAGTTARPDGGERAGAGARHAADGALEQVWLARARDRQQVGALGRLRHALRRHGRRIRAPQGHVQDRRVAPLASAQPARRPRADPRVDHRAGARAPSFAPTSGTRTRSRPTPPSTPCSRLTWSTTAPARSSWPTASTATRWSARSRSSTVPSTSVARPRPASSCVRRPSDATAAPRSRTAGETESRLVPAGRLWTRSCTFVTLRHTFVRISAVRSPRVAGGSFPTLGGETRCSRARRPAPCGRGYTPSAGGSTGGPWSRSSRTRAGRRRGPNTSAERSSSPGVHHLSPLTCSAARSSRGAGSKGSTRTR